MTSQRVVGNRARTVIWALDLPATYDYRPGAEGGSAGGFGRAVFLRELAQGAGERGPMRAAQPRAIATRFETSVRTRD